jgi:hypothetical protein
MYALRAGYAISAKAQNDSKAIYTTMATDDEMSVL